MASKTISITEEIYARLSHLKGENESFSQLFQRMIDIYQNNLKDCFGTWEISEEDYDTIWKDVLQRPGKKWDHQPGVQ